MSPVGGVGMALLTVWTTVVAISQPASNLNATPKRGRFRHINFEPFDRRILRGEKSRGRGSNTYKRGSDSINRYSGIQP